MTRLISKNVNIGERGPRTSMRLEPEVWDGLREICHREDITLATLVDQVYRADINANLSSNVRMHVLTYYRAAATEEGHSNALHGSA